MSDMYEFIYRSTRTGTALVVHPLKFIKRVSFELVFEVINITGLKNVILQVIPYNRPLHEQKRHLTLKLNYY